MKEITEMAKQLRDSADVVDQLNKDRDELLVENGRLKAVRDAAETISDLEMEAAGDDWDVLHTALDACPRTQ